MINNQPIRIAIIGCGAVTERGHLPAASQIPDCCVTLLVDQNLTRAKELARAYGIAAVSNDYHDAIGQADAAIIALPHNLHAQVSCELMKGGLHILVEKPMAMSSKECDTMIHAAEKMKVVLAVGLLRRFLNCTRFARHVLDHGFLGRIHSFDVREGNVYNWPVQSDFFFRRETAGGGVLLDTGAHALDLVLWWLGDVVDFDYYDDSYGGIEADCELHLKFKSGVKGIVELSRTRDLRNTAIIYGENGIIEVDLRRNWTKLSLHDNSLSLAGYGYASDLPDATEQQFDDLFKPQLEDWLAAIRGIHPTNVPGVEARHSIDLIEICYAKRRQLKLPWISPVEGI